MHISDGILSVPVYIAGYVLTSAITGVTLRKIKTEKSDQKTAEEQKTLTLFARQNLVQTKSEADGI